MLSRHTVFATALLAGTGLALAACGTKEAVATAGSTANPADVEFVTNAYNIINFDEQEATFVADKGKDPRVRALAAQFVQQAAQFRAGLDPVARGMSGITPPTQLPGNLNARLFLLRQNSTLGIDQSFIQDQIASHTDALNAQTAMMNDPHSTPQLADFARRGTAILKVNLEKLHTLQRQFMMEGKPA